MPRLPLIIYNRALPRAKSSEELVDRHGCQQLFEEVGRRSALAFSIEVMLPNIASKKSPMSLLHPPRNPTAERAVCRRRFVEVSQRGT